LASVTECAMIGAAGARRQVLRRRAVQLSANSAPLLDAIADAGVVGILATEEQQARVEEAANALQGAGDDAPEEARVPVRGTYDLLYSMAKGGSNGKVGPFIGKVSQIIVDEARFINQVELFNVLTVQLHAQREIIADDKIRVTFVETVFQLFGSEVSRKPTKGSGVWEQVYVKRAADGSAALRVMRTPSLFVLQQRTTP